jgi:hypothetical protein
MGKVFTRAAMQYSTPSTTELRVLYQVRTVRSLGIEYCSYLVLYIGREGETVIRVGGTENASHIDVTYQEKHLSKVVLSYTVQQPPTVVLVVDYTPAVEFVRIRHGVTGFLCRSVRHLCHIGKCANMTL